MEDELQPPDLGGWESNELQETARQYAGTGAEDRLPDEIRFLYNVAKLLRLRIATAGSKTDPENLAIFLLAPTPPEGIEPWPARTPMLDNGLSNVNGKIWLVSAAVISGYSLNLETSVALLFRIKARGIDVLLLERVHTGHWQ